MICDSTAAYELLVATIGYKALSTRLPITMGWTYVFDSAIAPDIC